MSKKTAWGVVLAAIVIYGGSTWWAGTKVRSVYDTAIDALSAQTGMVRVVDRRYDRGFFGAKSTVTLEIGCAADTAVQAPGGDKPVHITVRDIIHHGPFAGGTFAAATIDSELVLDGPAQAGATELFGTAKPLTVHTRIAFDGDSTSDIAVAPVHLIEAGKGEFAWEGAQVRIQTNAALTRIRAELTMPGMSASSTAEDLQLKVGKLTAKTDLDTPSGLYLATGKTEGRLESLEFGAPRDLGPHQLPHQAIPKVLLQDIQLMSDADIDSGLYASTATLKGKGLVGATAIERFEISGSFSRIQAAGYKKLTDALLQSWAEGRCGQSGHASLVAMQALAAQLAPDLKALAKYGPEMGLKMVAEIGGERGEISYAASMAGVTDEDLKDPGVALLMKRGVVTANARLPMKWIDQLAEVGVETGKTLPPEMVAGWVAQGEKKGFLKREGDDVSGQLEFRDGSLKINGKPLDAQGG